MINFKSFATIALTSLAITTAGVATMRGAEARDCYNGDGYKLCYDLTEQIGSMNRWDVTLTNSNTTEFMDVTCDGKEVHTWQSKGGGTQAEAQELADLFCSF